MNFETSQASRSKHELHVEHEQNLILLSLWSRSDNTLTLTSCCELITWNARQSMAALLSNMTLQNGDVAKHYDAASCT